MSAPTPDVPTITFRDTLLKITPWWLQGFIGVRLLYVLALHIDILAEMLVQAVRRRHPGLDSFDALRVSGKDRRIRRGRLEPDAIYAERLRTFLDAHRRRGGPYALLDQLKAFYAAAPYAIDLVYRAGTAFLMTIAGVITRSTVDTSLYDAAPQKWARWYLFFHWPTTPPTDGLWGDPGTWDDGGVWDSGLTPQEITDLKLVPSEWGNAHSRGTIVLLAPGDGPEDYTESGPMVRIAVDQ